MHLVMMKLDGHNFDVATFRYDGDSYIQSHEIVNSQTADKNDKIDAAEKMKALRGHLRDSFLTVKDYVVLPFTFPLVNKTGEAETDLQTIYSEQLTSLLKLKTKELEDGKDSQAERDYKNYLHTLNLVGNKNYKNLFLETDFDDLSDKELYKFIKTVNSVIVNDLSIIQKIKDLRIKWSDIINEIEMRTIAIDTYYSDDYYDEIGGILYTSYDFDTSGPRISILGETKRFDTTNFTMIANLIDELNRSELFNNAEMRSFSKSGSFESGYTSSIKLDLDLIKN